MLTFLWFEHPVVHPIALNTSYNRNNVTLYQLNQFPRWIMQRPYKSVCWFLIIWLREKGNGLGDEHQNWQNRYSLSVHLDSWLNLDALDQAGLTWPMKGETRVSKLTRLNFLTRPLNMSFNNFFCHGLTGREMIDFRCVKCEMEFHQAEWAVFISLSS